MLRPGDGKKGRFYNTRLGATMSQIALEFMGDTYTNFVILRGFRHLNYLRIDSRKGKLNSPHGGVSSLSGIVHYL